MRLWIPGRPAPQGSKDSDMRESSVYLKPWRAAIKKHVFQWYRDNDIKPEELPLLKGAVVFHKIEFHLDTGQRIDSPPDLDKLLRALFDGLGKDARLFEDDGRVVRVHELSKEQTYHDAQTGVFIDVTSISIGGEAI